MIKSLSYGTALLTVLALTACGGGDDYTEDASGPARARLPLAASLELDDEMRLSAGDGQSAAIRADGTLFMWGRNDYGQLGVGNTEYSATPLMVPGLSAVKAVRTGATHTVAL